jgi:CRP-like cAMP-binding protein
MFMGCDNQFLQDLASRTAVKVVEKGGIIINQGDQSNDIFFIVEGEVEVMSADLKSIYDIIQAGGFFGEVGILHGW